jgi:hypothetical protein
MTDTDPDLIMPTILNFGQDYAGSRDQYMYTYFIRKGDDCNALCIHTAGSTGKIDLARVPSSDPNNRNNYEFFAGFDGNGNPIWVSNASGRAAVFEDANGVGWNGSVSYNAGLGRYILITEHTSSGVGLAGVFEAPEPWGPWRTVKYYTGGFDAFGIENQVAQVKTTTWFWNFSNKWTNSADFSLIFTGYKRNPGNDSWNHVRGQFITGSGGDTVAPAAPTNLGVE